MKLEIHTYENDGPELVLDSENEAEYYQLSALSKELRSVEKICDGKTIRLHLPLKVALQT